MDPQRPERPAGIVLSAVALGLAAVVLLFLSLGGVAAILGGSHLPSGSAGGAVPPATVLTVVMLGMTLVYLALAGWAVGTLVGLLRMRSWARVSAMVIAGCLAGLSLLSALSMLAVQSAIASGGMPTYYNVNPAVLHKVCLAIAGVSGFVALLAILWLVYLAQRSVRDAFTRAAGAQAARPPFAYPGQQAGNPLSAVFARPVAPLPTAPNPLTDFTVARPLDPPTPAIAAPVELAPAAEPAVYEAHSSNQPAEHPWPHPQQVPFQPPPGAQPWPGSPVTPASAAARSRRPVSITILAVIALIGAFSWLLGVLSTTSIFLLGALIGGWTLRLYSLIWATALAISGLGMLRLQRPAWLLSFGLLGFNALNYLVLLLPGPRARYASYLRSLQQHSLLGLSHTAMPQAIVSMTITTTIFFGLALTALFAVLLLRARRAFAIAEPAVGSSEESHAG